MEIEKKGTYMSTTFEPVSTLIGLGPNYYLEALLRLPCV